MGQEVAAAARLVDPHLVHDLALDGLLYVFRRQVDHGIRLDALFGLESSHFVDIEAVLVRQHVGTGIA